MGAVIVVGSANVDTAVRTDAVPRAGETVLAEPVQVGAGGKGLNQAIAAAQAGASTVFVGAVGDDPHGGLVRAALERRGIDVRLAVSGAPTGSAFVVVDRAGENAIVVVPGANADEGALAAPLGPATTDLRGGTVLLTQLETPLPIVAAALRSARNSGAYAVLNAAPARELPAAVLDDVDLLIVNEHECRQLAPHAEDLRAAAAALARRVGAVVVTLGGAGALTVTGESVDRFAAYPVPVVDTTGAGDTFCGALCAALADGAALADAVRFGMAAAALTVQKPGAADSIPDRHELTRFLAGHDGAPGERSDPPT